MLKRLTIAMIAAALVLAPTDYASAAHAAGAVRGTKETITFEGLVRPKRVKAVPNGYDGFNWPGVYAAGKRIAEQSPGTKAVLDGKVVAANSASDNGGEGILSAVSGRFTLKSGHFAATCNSGLDLKFSAYRNGVLVGTNELSLDPVDTLVQFDSTFRRIDKVIIDSSGGTGDCPEVAFDDLVTTFN